MRSPLLCMLLALTVQDAPWSQTKRELEPLLKPEADGLARTQAVRRAGGYSHVEATKLLVQALFDSCAELQVGGRAFDRLSEELRPYLKQGADIRTDAAAMRTMEERTALGKHLIQEERVLDEIIASLAGNRDEESIRHLATLPRKPRDWRARARLAEVLGKIGSELACEELHKLLDDSDPRVVCYAAEALGLIRAAASVAPLSKLLKASNWQVRAFAVTSLQEIGHVDAIAALIKALSGETGILSRMIGDALVKLTGASFGSNYEAWSNWWRENADQLAAQGAKKVSVPPKAAVPSHDPFTYYGIKTVSERVLFVVDISDSMNDQADETVVPPDGMPKRTGNKRPKILVAKDQLVDALVQLAPATSFNIITYNKYVQSWKPALVQATPRNKNEALAYVLDIKASEATNIFEALELAFEYAGSGAYDRAYPSQVDTIFFLTDGKPTEGRIQDPQEILEAVRRLNRVSAVTIHTIGVGYLHDREFLKAMATQNGGQYVNVQ
ncbi:MAG: HEAT repeat domain-containing protein [Planctomycetota bacterium]